MLKLGWALSWILVGLFLLVGCFFVSEHKPLTSIPSVIMILLLFPPLRRFIHAKTGVKIPIYGRIIFIVILFLIIQPIYDREHRAYFNKHSASVISEVDGFIRRGNYVGAIREAQQYLGGTGAHNKELDDLYQLAITKRRAEITTAETKRGAESTTAKTDEKYTWASELTKATCDNIAVIGLKKGSRDRLVAIKDNNKIDFAYSYCPECSGGAKADIMTCYEIGYDQGYYGR